MKSYYHRNLPHWQPSGSSIFLTCRLYGSLPENVIAQLKQSQNLIAREIAKAKSSVESVAQLKLNQHKKLFAKFDTILDKAETGPLWLGIPEVANLVEDRDEEEFFRIVAYIENNPDKAGLVQHPGDWMWSSAAERRRRGWADVRALT